jgi:hypothetical protein
MYSGLQDSFTKCLSKESWNLGRFEIIREAAEKKWEERKCNNSHRLSSLLLNRNFFFPLSRREGERVGRYRIKMESVEVSASLGFKPIE